MNNPEVVKDSYITALKGKKVIEAIFTTFTLDLEFFESEVLWILTGDKMDEFSPNNDVRRRELAHYYQNNKLPVTVYFDRKANDWDVEEQEQVFSPLIEYLLVPVDSGNHAFHPKITMLLLEDKDKKRSILYVNGSNNITYNGWWENVECINIESLYDSESDSKSLYEECKKSVEYFSKKRQIIDYYEKPFEAFNSLLEKNVIPNNTKDRYFSFFDKDEPFIDFLKSSNINFNNYNMLEIISPYFAEEEKKVLDLIDELSAINSKVKLFLPKNEDSALLCSEKLFTAVNESEKISWATFNEAMQESLQIKTMIKTEDDVQENKRKVHAKIFHWHNSQTKESLFFVGSVNLSFKAFNQNEEAGKLIFIDSGEELLMEVKEDNPSYAEDTDIFDEDKDNLEDTINVFKNLSLLYDWKTKKLTSTLSSEKGKLNKFKLLLNSNNITLQKNIDFKDNNELEANLNANPFANIQHGNVRRNLFVNQKNFTYKPLDLGTLSFKEILDIYSKFGLFSKDNKLIKNAIERALKAKGIESDMDISDINLEGKSFFSEYAEIFYGLRHLKNLVIKHPEKVEYFFDENTKAMDSIPTLIDESLKDSSMDLTSKYITLLYIKQIYHELERDEAFIDNYILKIKEENKEEFKENEKFIQWFEKAFFMEFSKGKS